MQKQKRREEKGITLVALVVTIIVLLILAGVTLNLTIRQNGIFSRAETAANTWRNAEQNEQLAIGELEELMDGYLNGNSGNQGGENEEYNTATTVIDAISQNKPFEFDTTITDSCEPANSVRVPAGFKIAQESATLVENGIVIEDTDGNQFVWIPADTGDGQTVNMSNGENTKIVYERVNFGKQNDIYSNYTENLSEDEKSSVEKWKGYYIGRYEAGDGEAINNNGEKELRTSSSPQTHKVIIQKNQVPYNWITFDNAIVRAEEMSRIQSYTATTKLASSYAWDTAIKFIQLKNSNYGTTSPEGNYTNSETFNYIDINEIEQQGPNNDIVPTGQTKAVSNIYDLGGNLWEYTSERKINTGSPYVVRGGAYDVSYLDFPAGSRNNFNGIENETAGFRIALYCNID